MRNWNEKINISINVLRIEKRENDMTILDTTANNIERFRFQVNTILRFLEETAKENLIKESQLKTAEANQGRYRNYAIKMEDKARIADKDLADILKNMRHKTDDIVARDQEILDLKLEIANNKKALDKLNEELNNKDAELDLKDQLLENTKPQDIVSLMVYKVNCVHICKDKNRNLYPTEGNTPFEAVGRFLDRHSKEYNIRIEI